MIAKPLTFTLVTFGPHSVDFHGAVHKLCRLNRWGKGDYFLKDLLKWKRRHMGEGVQNCLFWEHSLWTAPCSTVPLLSTDGWRESRCELFLFLFAVSLKKNTRTLTQIPFFSVISEWLKVWRKLSSLELNPFRVLLAQRTYQVSLPSF